MIITDEINQLRQQISDWRQRGERIAFVPTMGNLHQGHLQLIEIAKQQSKRIVVSIFINPMQFDQPSDLESYPRTLRADCTQLENEQVDLLFTPRTQQFYPKGVQHHTFVEVPDLSYRLEGALRPNHFRGVATVICKLFNIVQPDIACFGQKDFQQLALIRALVEDLAFPITILGVPTVRADDGLALSSRNRRLSPEQRQLAPKLSEVMFHLGQRLQAQPELWSDLIEQGTCALNAAGFVCDGIDIVDAATLNKLDAHSNEAVILMAAFLGETRLIDNLVIDLRTNIPSDAPQ